jgi:hypothetical protein
MAKPDSAWEQTIYGVDDSLGKDQGSRYDGNAAIVGARRA